MIFGIHLGHHLLNVVVLDLIHGVTEDTTGAGIALGDDAYFVGLSCHIYAGRTIGAHRGDIIHIVVQVVGIEIVLLDIGSIFSSGQQILPAFFIVKNFN